MDKVKATKGTKALNTRQADTRALRGFLKGKGKYKAGMTRNEMVAVVNAVIQTDQDVIKIDAPDRTEIHRVRRAIYALERRTGQEVTEAVALKKVRVTFSDFSDKGFAVALAAIL